MPTKTVTDADFETQVLGAEEPVLVDFWAAWCGPCKMIAPALEELSDELGGRVTIAKMDIEDNPETPGRLGVRGIPALKLFKGGEQVAELLGARPKAALRQWLEGQL